MHHSGFAMSAFAITGGLMVMEDSVEEEWEGNSVPEPTIGPHTIEMTQIEGVEGAECLGS